MKIKPSKYKLAINSIGGNYYYCSTHLCLGPSPQNTSLECVKKRYGHYDFQCKIVRLFYEN
jgi:hypothetical protein